MLKNKEKLNNKTALEADNSSISDTELILAHKNGVEGTIDVLITRYKDYIFNLSYRFMRNYEDAMDLMQESLIRIYRGIDKYEERNYFKGWIYRIINNAAINMYKKSSNRESPYMEKLEILDDSRYNSESNYERTYLKEKIYEALQKIKGKQKDVFILRYHENMSYEEIGKILKMSSDSAKSNYFYALKKMEQLMQKERTML